MCTEKFGVEIETLSKFNLRQTTQIAVELFGIEKVDTTTNEYHRHDFSKWGFESDTSLSGSIDFRFGVEMITPPMKINDLSKIRDLLRKLKGNIQVNSSCGLHVHVECKEAKTAKNVLLIWQRFEDQIIKIFPPSRQNHALAKRIKGFDRETLLDFAFDRYHMVNVSCWVTKGTVEFRGHSGTIDYPKIKRWVLFVTRLVEKAKSFETIFDLDRILGNNNLCMFHFLGLNGTKTEKYIKGRTIHFEKLEKERERERETQRRERERARTEYERAIRTRELEQIERRQTANDIMTGGQI